MRRPTFVASLLSAVVTAQTNRLGKSCVPTILIDLFDDVNELRQQNVKASAYLDYEKVAVLSAAAQIGDGDYQLPLRQGEADKDTPMTKQVKASRVVGTHTAIMQLEQQDTKLFPLTWNEGMAKAAQSYAETWRVDSMDTLASFNDRLKENGRVKKSTYTVETAITFQAYEPDAIDLTRMLMTNSDRLAKEEMTRALFEDWKEVTQFGAAFAVSENCVMSVKDAWQRPPVETGVCDAILVVVAGNKYQNKRGLEKCQPNISFGGGLCNPDSSTPSEAVYKELLNLRLNAYSVYRPYLVEIQAACLTFGTFKWDGVTESECPKEYAEKIAEAISAIAGTMKGLGHLDWTPGLYLAAQEGSQALAKVTDKELLQSLEEEKLYEYAQIDRWGDAGQVTTGILYYGNDTPKNAVARMLIDNFDGKATDALLNTAVTQAGVSISDAAPGAAWGKIGAVLLDGGFETTGSWKECKAPRKEIKRPPRVPKRQCKRNKYGECGAYCLAVGATAALWVALF